MSLWDQLENEIEDFRGNIRSRPVGTDISPDRLREELERRYDFSSPVSLEELTAQVIGLLRSYTVHVTHPRYFGLFNPGVRYAAIVADLLVALYNPQLAAWSHAPAANEIEQLTLRYFCGRLGWNPGSAMMNFTSGGMEANLSAVLSAVAHRFPETGRQGLGRLSAAPVIYITAESHHSFVKIARMAGMGTDCLREVTAARNCTMDTVELERLIRADKSRGMTPFLVVGTAGTTGGGLIDPLLEIAEISSRHGLWFHADAAWGGSALLSPGLRPLLKGIELADSVTWDAHKWLSVPMGAGMFFCRHVDAVTRAFVADNTYMPGRPGTGVYDPYAVTAQWSRRLIGLKVFMSLAEAGEKGYGAIIDHQAGVGEILREKLAGSGWIVVNDTRLPVVCFTHEDIRSGRLTTSRILKLIYKRNRVWISDVALGGRELVLRACITSFQSDETDIDCLLEEIEHARRQLTGRD